MDVLDAIEEEVKKMKHKYIRIDGSIATEKRHNYVHTFQNDDECKIAILSITACATGLTLTKASTVVFAEMHFTPAIMIQAEDRAHRIGQEHNCVNVHYLYGADTVDEIIFPKLQEKFAVVSSTLDNKRMNMDVHKVKSKVGDIAEVQSVVSIQPETIKKPSNYTLDNFFKKSDKKKTEKDDSLLIRDLNESDIRNILNDEEDSVDGLNIHSNNTKRCYNDDEEEDNHNYRKKGKFN